METAETQRVFGRLTTLTCCRSREFCICPYLLTTISYLPCSLKILTENWEWNILWDYSKCNTNPDRTKTNLVMKFRILIPLKLHYLTLMDPCISLWSLLFDSSSSPFTIFTFVPIWISNPTHGHVISDLRCRTSFGSSSRANFVVDVAIREMGNGSIWSKQYYYLEKMRSETIKKFICQWSNTFWMNIN